MSIEPAARAVLRAQAALVVARTRRGDVYRPLTLTERGRRQAAIAAVGDAA
jgi:hypothetical protein